MTGLTLYDKLWNDHLVKQNDDGMDLIYIDRHLIHEVTSPQAFEGLRLANRKPHRIDANLAVPDHNIPTTDRDRGITDPIAKLQVDTLDKNCNEFGIVEFDMSDMRQGIVHVISPEQGATLPGMTIVCGDSHTATHGAFGALAFGIGTSEVEHVLATQCLRQQKMKNMLIRVNGQVSDGISAKDIVLDIIGKLGTAGGTGYAVEFAGSAIESLSMEGRMTVCNMAIEAGARGDSIIVDAFDFPIAETIPDPEPLEFYEEDLFKLLLKPVVAFISVVLLIFLVFKPMITKLTRGTIDMAGVNPNLASDQLSLSGNLDGMNLPPPGRPSIAQVDRAKTAVGDDPAMVAQVVKNWMESDEQ